MALCVTILLNLLAVSLGSRQRARRRSSLPNVVDSWFAMMLKDAINSYRDHVTVENPWYFTEALAIHVPPTADSWIQIA